jgi:hypothetical protein
MAYHSTRINACPLTLRQLVRLVEPVHDLVQRLDDGHTAAFAEADAGAFRIAGDEGDLGGVDGDGHAVCAGELHEHGTLLLSLFGERLASRADLASGETKEAGLSGPGRTLDPGSSPG